MSAFAAVSALPVSAESGRGVEQIGAVHPDRSRFDLGSRVQRQVDVLRPDAGREPVPGVVRQLDGLGWGPERHHHDDRAEDLDSSDGRRGRHVGTEGGRVEPPLLRDAPGRLPDARPLLPSPGHQILNLFELHGSDDGPHVDPLVQRIAHAELLHPRAKLRLERLCHALLHQDPGTGTAHLALVEPDGVHHPLDHAVQVCILVHDEGRLASQLAILSTSGCATRAAPVVPSPVTMFTTPGGSPTSPHSSAKRSAVSGVNSAGLRTTVFPVARAGAIFQASISRGKFHGMI